jgi:hypothetical protein
MRLSVSARRALDPCWSTSSSSEASEAGMLIPHHATDLPRPDGVRANRPWNLKQNLVTRSLAPALVPQRSFAARGFGSLRI